MIKKFDIFEFIKSVWDFPRSITGKGVRDTLKVIQQHLPNLHIDEVASGTKFWDWQVPDEWSLERGRLIDPLGKVVVDSKYNPLHIVNYSVNFQGEIELESLQKHLHSVPDLPEAIPYRTSYYQRTWGFCISHSVRESLKPGKYLVDINAEHFKGSMSIGSLYLPGKTRKEVIFSTYICHPNLANNELSGPGIAVALAKYLYEIDHYYSYRILFLPETIGSIYYLSKNLQYLKENCLAGYVLTCLGDGQTWSFLSSRTGITLADKVAKRVLNNMQLKYKEYSFLERGSDERQFCSPLINLPFCSVMRSKYGTYKEYHTSLDNLSFISREALYESFAFFLEVLSEFESNRVPKSLIFGEPMFSKRNLRNTLGGGDFSGIEKQMSNIVAYSDGENDYASMKLLLGLNDSQIQYLINKLETEKILEIL